MGNIQAGKGEIFSAMARAQKSMIESSSKMAERRDDEQHQDVSPETPWLITTAAQLHEQEVKTSKLRELCEKSFSVNLSYAEKLKWSEIHTRNFMASEQYGHVDLGPVMRNILYDHCSENVHIIVLMSKHALSKISSIKLDDETLLRTGFKCDENNEKSKNDYVSYVCKNTYKGGHVTIVFELNLQKQVQIDTVFEKLKQKITLPDGSCYLSLAPMKINPNLETKLLENVQRIGELPYFFQNENYSVTLELSVVSSDVESPLEEVQRFERIKEKEKKAYLLIRNYNEKDHTLWINDHYDDSLKRINGHIMMGEKECDFVRKNTKKFRLDLYEANLVYLMKNPFKMAKSKLLCELLALTSILASDEDFLGEIGAVNEAEDDDLEHFEEFFDDLGQFWQTLLQFPDESLEISIDLDAGNDNGGDIKAMEQDANSRNINYKPSSEVGGVLTATPNGSEQFPNARDILHCYLRHVCSLIGNATGIVLDMVGDRSTGKPEEFPGAQNPVIPVDQDSEDKPTTNNSQKRTAEISSGILAYEGTDGLQSQFKKAKCNNSE